MTHARRDRRPHAAARRGERGFVLVTALVLITLTLGITYGFARHAITATASSRATLGTLGAERAAWSGVAYGCQTLRSGQPARAMTLAVGDQDAAITFETLDAATHRIVVDATDGATGASLLAEVALVPAAGPTPPRLTSEAVTALLADPALVPVRGTTRYTDVTLDAIFLLEPGAILVLEDVLLSGGIVDRQALDGTLASTRVELHGGVRVTPGGTLPGAALVVPGASVVGSSDATVEIDGMVVARTFSLTGRGYQSGALVTEEAPLLGRAFARPGAGRAPLAWSAAVAPAAWELAALAFPAHAVAAPERARIGAYPFAPRRR